MPKIVDHEQRRIELAEAACIEISKQGIERAKLVDIAKRAGCTTGSLVHYFPDKNSLLVAALDHSINRMHLRMKARARSDRDGPIGYFYETLPISRIGRIDNLVWWRFWMTASENEWVRSRGRRFHQRWIKEAISCLELMQENGDLGEIDDLAAEAETITALINGIALQAIQNPSQWPGKKQIALLDRYIARLK